MIELEVRIVKLEPMRVASFHAYGNSPEREAGKKLIAWSKPKGLLDDPIKHRIFGFDNPSPMPGSPNYGYEFWIVIDPDQESEDDVKVKECSGGMYAVLRCEVSGDPWESIPAAWQRLVAWREGSSKYRCLSGDYLEEHIGPFEIHDNFTLDLYMPISE